MVRNSAERRDSFVSASMECVRYREVQLNARKAYTTVAKGVWLWKSWKMVLGSPLPLPGRDMLLAWARDCAMRYTSVPGMLGNSPRCCYLGNVSGKSLVL